MSKGLLAQWRRGLIGRGVTGALLLAVPVATAAVIGLSGGFGSVTGGLSELTTGPQGAVSTAPPANGLNSAVVAVAGGAPAGTTPGGQPGGGDNPSGGGGNGTTPTTGGGGGNGTIPNVVPDVPSLPGGGGGNGPVDVNGTVDQVVGGANDTVGGVLGGN